MISQHPKYYFADGNLAIQVRSRIYRDQKFTVSQVQDTLFKVHPYLLSPGVSRMEPLNSTAERHDDDPIHIPKVTSPEFESLLHVLYHP